MIKNEKRIGRFTSSEIAALNSTGNQDEGFGVAAITYIAEKRMERLLGRSIKTETNARPLTWGKLLEPRVFELLPLSYTLSSTETDEHPEYGDIWAGSKDGTNEIEEKSVTDSKCPMTLKSFVMLVMPLYLGLDGNEAINAIRNGFEHNGIQYPKHPDGEDYYQQLVSNAEINKVDWAELIVYMPYQSELSEIRLLSEGKDNAMWITFSNDDDLPYLTDGGFFKNINIIRFRVPKEDKELLTKNVLKAGKLLLK